MAMGMGSPLRIIWPVRSERASTVPLTGAVTSFFIRPKRAL